jgi:hypothetical protein
MAQFALKLQVFIASPGDVEEERDIASAVIAKVAEEVRKRNIMLVPYRWEHNATPGLGRPQDLINPDLKQSELVIAIFGERIGSPSSLHSPETGSEEELRLTRELIRRGESDEVFVYFKSGIQEADVRDQEQFRKVNDLKASLEQSRSVFGWRYKSTTEFEEALRKHVADWVTRWERILDIALFTLKNSHYIKLQQEERPENTLDLLRRIVDWDHYPDDLKILGQTATEHYQTYGPPGISQPLALTSKISSAFVGSSPLPLTKADRQLFFSADVWYHFFCAYGLFHAILEDRVKAVDRIPYANRIHQLLLGIIHLQEANVSDRICENLVKWLKAKNGKPIARNYAAYSLGMFGFLDASDHLADAAINDTGRDVKLYCITSLGKLRARRHKRLLIDFYNNEPQENMRVTIGQALCRLTGLIDYEL